MKPWHEQTGWTEKRIATLKTLWADGISCSVIAARMGGITRNAVIGKVARLGLHSRNTKERKPRIARRVPIRSSSAPPPPRRPQDGPPLASVPLPMVHADDIARKTLDQLERNDCRFPVGDPRDVQFGFCALQKHPGSSYCAGHAARCSTAPHTRPGAPREDTIIRRKNLVPA